VQELDRGRGHARGARPQEVEELTVARVLHGLLDELNDGGGSVGLGLRVKAEHTCRWKQ